MVKKEMEDIKLFWNEKHTDILDKKQMNNAEKSMNKADKLSEKFIKLFTELLKNNAARPVKGE